MQTSWDDLKLSTCFRVFFQVMILDWYIPWFVVCRVCICNFCSNVNLYVSFKKLFVMNSYRMNEHSAVNKHSVSYEKINIMLLSHWNLYASSQISHKNVFFLIHNLYDRHFLYLIVVLIIYRKFHHKVSLAAW